MVGTIVATKNDKKSKNNPPPTTNHIAVKGELISGSITLTTSYLFHRGLSKWNYVPLSWDPLSILGSFAAGVGGLGLLYYSYYNSHRCYAILQKENYVEWGEENAFAEERKQQEKELTLSIKKSKKTQTSYAALYKTWHDNPRIKEGKSDAIDRCFNRAFYSLIAGIILTGISIASNPVGFKASNALLHNVHPWAVGVFSAGINMLMIKSCWALIQKDE